MFRAHVLIVRRAKFYYTVSGIIIPIGGRPVHRLREPYKQVRWVRKNMSILIRILLYF